MALTKELGRGQVCKQLKVDAWFYKTSGIAIISLLSLSNMDGLKKVKINANCFNLPVAVHIATVHFATSLLFLRGFGLSI